MLCRKAGVLRANGYSISDDIYINANKDLLKGDPNDKEYQKKIVDNLAYKVYIYDDKVVTYFNMHGKDMETISLADVPADLSWQKYKIKRRLIMLDNIIKSIAERFNIDPSKLSRDTNILTDIGADSLDIIDMLMVLEQEYKMTIDDAELEKIKTIGNIEDYFAKRV